MAKYPDFRSAAIPALHAVQREHGWCSPTAIEQAACVMRLTPAYLTAVATFYDMFETVAEGRARRLRVHEHLVLAARRRRDLRRDAGAPPAPTRDFNVRGVRVPRRVRHRADGVGRRRVRRAAAPSDDCRTIVDDLKAGRAAAARTSSSRARKVAPSTAGDRPSEALLQDIDEPGLNTLDGLRAPRRLRDAAQGAEDGARTTCSHEMLGSERARPRRRRLRDGQEDVLPPQGDDGQVPRLQRRRVRARDVQGPRADAEEPAPADRGHDHRGVRVGAQPLVHLHPRRVRAPGRRARGRGRRGARRPATSASTSSAPTTRSTWSCTAAPAPTSAARRPRCSTRSRASAATRA